MRGVRMEDELVQIEFAKRAAACFESDSRKATFTDGEITPGCLFAVRWGLGDDCVLVLKLDETHVPTNYYQLIRAARSSSL